MERGTEWEQQALKREWDTMVRERKLATQFALGMTFLFGSLPLLVMGLAYPFEICSLPLYAGGKECMQTSMGAGTQVLLLSLGVTFPLLGAILCRRARNHYGGRAG